MKWPRRVPAWLQVAAGGYGVVGVFGLTIWRVRSGWPNLDQRTALLIGAAVAAPLGLAMVWQRLATLKFFGVEVSLSSVTVSVDENISAALSQQQYFSGTKHLISQMRGAIMNPELKLIEVNLHSEPYWWSTRLFLLATLTDLYSDVETFVIVEGGADRRFVGMVSPHALRNCLGKLFPELEATYQRVQLDARNKPELAWSPADQVDEIVEKWTVSQFNQDGGVFSEEQRKLLVTSQLLASWLAAEGGKLETDYVHWDGGPDSPLLNYMLVCRSSPFVALIREKRLEKVVNRIELAKRVAQSALRRQLS